VIKRNGHSDLLNETLTSVSLLADQVEKLSGQVRADHDTGEQLRNELQRMLLNVKSLMAMVRGGDGDRSLLTRMMSVEMKLSQVEQRQESQLDLIRPPVKRNMIRLTTGSVISVVMTISILCLIIVQLIRN
jgi:hypothetical protein